jgi:hypothetical protein
VESSPERTTEEEEEEKFSYTKQSPTQQIQLYTQDNALGASYHKLRVFVNFTVCLWPHWENR